MIAALAGLLLPVAAVFYGLGLLHGARDAHDDEADVPVSFGDLSVGQQQGTAA